VYDKGPRTKSSQKADPPVFWNVPTFQNYIVRLKYGSLLLGPLFSVLSVPTFQENIRMVRVPAFYLFERPSGSGPGSAHFKSPGCSWRFQKNKSPRWVWFQIGSGSICLCIFQNVKHSEKICSVLAGHLLTISLLQKWEGYCAYSSIEQRFLDL